MKFNSQIQQHFSIRKLSVGAASVLIGISFLGYGAQTVHADTMSNVSDTQKQADNTHIEKPVATPVATKTATPVAKNEEKVDSVKTDTAQQAAKIQEPVAEAKTTTSEKGNVVKKNTAAELKPEKTQGTEEKATDVKAADTKKPESPRTADSADKDTKEQTLKIDKKKAVVAPKDLKDKKIEETPAWNLNDWDKTVTGDDMTLNKYIGTGADTVYIPNAADVRTDNTYRNIKKVKIDKNTISSLVGKTHNLTISKTNNEKVYAQGSMRAAFQSYSNNWHKLDLTNLDTSSVDDMNAMFANEQDLTSVGDLSGWDTRHVTNMQWMFNECHNLGGQLNLSNWNTQNVTDMSHMFQNNYQLTGIKGLTNWDTSNVTDLSSMFYECHSLQSIRDISSWNTAKVTNMNHLFFDCWNLRGVGNLSHWQTGNVTDMSFMFCNLENNAPFNERDSEDLSGWDTAKVRSFDSMFDKARFAKLNLKNWQFGENSGQLSLKKALETMADCSEIDVTGWNVSNLTNLSSMFNLFHNLTKVTGLETWDVSHATNLSYMFNGDDKLTSVGDLSNWRTDNVTNMAHMFDGDAQLTTTGNLDNWNTSKVTDMSFMFNGDQALQNIGDISNWDVRNVESMINMFSGTSSLKQTQDLSKWNQIKADESYMFDNSALVVKGSFDFNVNGFHSYINSKKNAEKLDVSHYKTDRVTDMSKLFQGFTKLKQIIGLGTWDVSNVTDMSHMFDGDDQLTSVGNVSDWDVSHVTTMNSMFRDCHALTSIDLSWGNKTKNVTDFSGMFANDYRLKTINGINDWDVENATDLSFMFQSVNGTPWPGDPNGFYNYSATGALKQLDLSNWKNDKVQNMEGLFWGQQDLKSVGNFDNWKTDNVQKMDNMFAFCANLQFSPAAIANMAGWQTGNVTTMRELFEGLEKQKDLSCVQNWDTHNVRDMSYMFSGDKALTNVGNLEHRGYIWDTSKVGTDQPAGAPEKQNYGMSLMFANCESLPEIKGINSWNVSNVTKMRGMFQNTTSLKDIDLSNWNTQSLKIAGQMFYESGAQSINLSGWDFRHLAHFSDSGMTTNPARYLVHRGIEFMFADLEKPCVITMNNIKLPANRKEGFDVIDFAGYDNVPLVVFSPELLAVHGANSDAALNEETWGWDSVADQTGRQNANYLTYYKKGDTSKKPIAYQKMNFVFASPKQLRTMLILASLPTGQADASSSDILADYAKELSAVDKVKKALGPTLASKWKSAADLQGNFLRDVLNALNDPAETPVALVSAKYGLTFNATARIHYIDATNQTGTLTHDPAHEITSEERDYDPTSPITGASLPTWDYVGHGWQLKTTDLPETMGAADCDYYVYLVAPEKTKTITETINYVIGNNPVDASIAGNPVSGPKVITFTQQETGFDRLTLRPIYGRWTGSVDAITAPATVKDSSGNVYSIDLAHVNSSDPRIGIDSARNIHLNIDPDSVNDGAAFTLTIPYVRSSEPVNPGDHHPTTPTKPDKKPNKPSEPGKDGKPVKPGKSDHLKNNADKGSKDISGQHHSTTQNRSVRRHAVAGRVNRTTSQSKVSGKITQRRKEALPQTGASRRSSQVGLVALGLASLAALLGLAGTRKKNKS